MPYGRQGDRAGLRLIVPHLGPSDSVGYPMTPAPSLGSSPGALLLCSVGGAFWLGVEDACVADGPQVMVCDPLERGPRRDCLLVPVQAEFEPSLSLRTSTLCTDASTFGRSTLRGSIIASPSPLQPLAVLFGEGRASRKRCRRSAQDR